MTRDLAPFLSLEAQVDGAGLDPATWEALRTRWGQPAGGAATRRIRIVRGTLPPPPDMAPLAVPVSGETLPVWLAGNQAWLGEGELHLALTDAGAVLTAGARPTEAAWVLAFVEAHRAGGWLPLHAAVLTVPSGQGVAVTGASGAGKSTAALRLAGAGATVLAEDQAWVRPTNGLTVGLDTHLRAFEDSVRRFAPHLLTRAAGRDAHGKLRLPLTRPGGRTTLDTLLVFGLPPQPDAAARVRAVWEATGVPLTPAARQAAAGGVQALLPRLRVQGVTRENVVEAAQARLALSPPETGTLPGSAGG
ncbi:hypothetical protein Dcar01_00680 [Deinococcus carri]|uniref:Hpr(Ser) kinase/phosphatase n=1 Tax=Deinococcus carri TaxID=1211323 RepID=A0ABP9W3M9_9DEIO